MNLTETAMIGDRLSTLKALRKVLCETIESTSSARETATLACQLRQVLAEIAELENAKPKDDDITQILSRRKEEGRPGLVRSCKNNDDL